MKKNLFFGLAVAGLFLTSASLLSCQSNDDDTAILESPSSGSLEDEYFTIEGAVYKGDQFPSSTSDGEMSAIDARVGMSVVGLCVLGVMRLTYAGSLNSRNRAGMCASCQVLRYG